MTFHAWLLGAVLGAGALLVGPQRAEAVFWGNPSGHASGGLSGADATLGAVTASSLTVTNTSTLTGPVNAAGLVTASSLTVTNTSILNGNVGIGTSNPTTKVHVSSGTVTLDGNVSPSISANQQIKTTSASGFSINDAGNGVDVQFGTGGDGLGFFGTGTQDAIRFITGNSTRMTLMSTTGNLGIDDTTPDASFEVLSTQAPTEYVIAVSSQNDVTGNILNIVGSGVVTVGNNILSVNPNTFTVGIGTATPQRQVEIAGTSPGMQITGPATTTSRVFGLSEPGALAQLQVIGSGDSPATRAGRAEWTNTSATGDMVFFLGGIANPAFTISNSNTVGINLADLAEPSATLEVNGTTHLNGSLTAKGGILLNTSSPYVTFTGVTSTPTATATTASIWAIGDGAATEVKVVDSAGNVTQISPHNPEGEWVFYSENVQTGKRVYINMEKFIRRMEQITGEKFIFNEASK